MHIPVHILARMAEESNVNNSQEPTQKQYLRKQKEAVSLTDAYIKAKAEEKGDNNFRSKF